MPNLWNETEVLEAAVDVVGADESSVVQRLHRRIGYVPAVALEFLAVALAVPLSTLVREAFATTNLRSAPPKSRTLYVCDGIGCSSPYCQDFAAQVVRTLGIDFFDQTADGALRLKPLRCRGTPVIASTLMVDDEVFEVSTLGEFEDLLGWLMNG